MRLLPILLATMVCAGAERRAVAPAGITPIGPYSPGILTKDFLYVSGQGAKGGGGWRECFENVKTIVEAAGLTMKHVVYTQVYLTDAKDEGPLNAVWKEYFPESPPARSIIVVAALPGTPVEMSAVAIRDLSQKKPVGTSGVIAGDRMYLSGSFGRDADTALDGMEATLKAAGLDFRHMVFVNPYLTDQIPMAAMNKAYAKRFEFGNTPARATIQVAGLPGGANIEFTGVAVVDLAKRRAVRPKNMEPSPTASPCVFAADTLFCSAKSGFIPGVNGGIYASTVETQLRQTMRNLLDGLEEVGMDFSNVATSNVYLDDVQEFAKMNGVYAEYFRNVPPARTTIQQLAPGKRQPDGKGRWPTLEQISIIAVR
jgi:aminoacrylate peracid reductase